MKENTTLLNIEQPKHLKQIVARCAQACEGALLGPRQAHSVMMMAMVMLMMMMASEGSLQGSKVAYLL